MQFKFVPEKNEVLKTTYGFTDRLIDSLAKHELEQFKRELESELKSNRIHTLRFRRRDRIDDNDVCWHGCDKVSHVYGFSSGGGS